MRVIRKEEISNAIKNPNAEEIYEMIGRSLAIGGTTHHSLVHVVIPPGKSSHAHFREVSEETYYFLKGVGLMRIGEEIRFGCTLVKPASSILMKDIRYSTRERAI